MGAYIYRVSAKVVKLADGSKANLAVFAYKPYGWDEKANNKMARLSGCFASDRFVEGKNFTGKIVMGHIDRETGKVTLNDFAYKYDHKRFGGSFYDSAIEKMEVVGKPA